MSSAKLRRCSNVVPLRLVRNPVCASLVDELEILLDGARRGEINGMAYACTRPGAVYFTNLAGACADSPTLSRGAVMTLVDELGEIVRNRAGENDFYS